MKKALLGLVLLSVGMLQADYQYDILLKGPRLQKDDGLEDFVSEELIKLVGCEISIGQGHFYCWPIQSKNELDSDRIMYLQAELLKMIQRHAKYATHNISDVIIRSDSIFRFLLRGEDPELLKKSTRFILQLQVRDDTAAEVPHWIQLCTDKFRSMLEANLGLSADPINFQLRPMLFARAMAISSSRVLSMRDIANVRAGLSDFAKRTSNNEILSVQVCNDGVCVNCLC